MATTIYNGVTTSSVLADSQILQMNKKIMQIDPNYYPVQAILELIRQRNKQGKRRVDNSEYKFMSDVKNPTAIVLNGNVTLGAHTGDIIVTSGHELYASINDKLAVPPNAGSGGGGLAQILQVTARDTSAHTLTVKLVESTGSANISNIATGTTIYNIGNVSSERDSPPQAKNIAFTEATNYVEEIRTPVEVTDRQRMTANYAGDLRAYERNKQFKAHMEAREWRILFGEAQKTTNTTGYLETHTAGVIPQISTNIESVAYASFTYTNLLTLFNKVFPYGSKSDKIMFCGTYTIQRLITYALATPSAFQLTSKTTQYGLGYIELVTPYGTIAIKQHELLVDGYYGYGLIFDPTAIDLVYMGGINDTALQDAILVKDIQDIGATYVKDEYRTIFGTELHNEKAFGILKIT